MSIILDHQKLTTIDARDYVTTKEANDLFPMFSQDYIGRLLRDGMVDGFQLESGRWRVNLKSLRAFVEHSEREEIIRNERVRFERLQEKKVQLLPPPVSQLYLSPVPVQSLVIFVSGLLAGVFLFLGSVILPANDDSWSTVAEIITTTQLATVSKTSNSTATRGEEFQVSGGYVEVIHLSQTGKQSVLFQSVMDLESVDFTVSGVPTKEAQMAAVTDGDRAATIISDSLGQQPALIPESE